jgi:hypothetical protein
MKIMPSLMLLPEHTVLSNEKLVATPSKVVEEEKI